MQGWTAATRHGLTREREKDKDKKHIGKNRNIKGTYKP